MAQTALISKMESSTRTITLASFVNACQATREIFVSSVSDSKKNSQELTSCIEFIVSKRGSMWAQSVPEQRNLHQGIGHRLQMPLSERHGRKELRVGGDGLACGIIWTLSAEPVLEWRPMHSKWSNRLQMYLPSSVPGSLLPNIYRSMPSVSDWVESPARFPALTSSIFPLS